MCTRTTPMYQKLGRSCCTDHNQQTPSTELRCEKQHILGHIQVHQPQLDNVLMSEKDEQCICPAWSRYITQNSKPRDSVNSADVLVARSVRYALPLKEALYIFDSPRLYMQQLLKEQSMVPSPSSMREVSLLESRIAIKRLH